MPVVTDFKILLVGDNKVGKPQILVAFGKGGHKYTTPILGKTYNYNIASI